MRNPTRRDFVKTTLLAGAAAATPLAGAGRPHGRQAGQQNEIRPGDLSLGQGLGPAHADRQLREARVLGVELRTTHAHGVEPNLDRAGQRREVENASPTARSTLVGLGSNERVRLPRPQGRSPRPSRPPRRSSSSATTAAAAA